MGNVTGNRLHSEIGETLEIFQKLARMGLTSIGVSEAKSQEGRKFFYRLTMGYLINILPADFNSITG